MSHGLPAPGDHVGGLGDADIGGPEVLVVHDGPGPRRHAMRVTRQRGGAGGRGARLTAVACFISTHNFSVIFDIFRMFSRQQWARNSGHSVRLALLLTLF